MFFTIHHTRSAKIYGRGKSKIAVFLFRQTIGKNTPLTLDSRWWAVGEQNTRDSLMIFLARVNTRSMSSVTSYRYSILSLMYHHLTSSLIKVTDFNPCSILSASGRREPGRSLTRSSVREFNFQFITIYGACAVFQ